MTKPRRRKTLSDLRYCTQCSFRELTATQTTVEAEIRAHYCYGGKTRVGKAVTKGVAPGNWR